jgi:hypothetical protein
MDFTVENLIQESFHRLTEQGMNLDHYLTITKEEEMDSVKSSHGKFIL